MKGIGLVGLAFKLLPKLLKVFKGLKFTKVGLAGASFASYAFLFNWKFAVVLMLALGIHETGHVWAMRKMGVKTKGFYFLPFIGGAAVAEEHFPSRPAEVFIALMGPIWGLGTAIIPAILYFVTGNVWFAAISSWIAMLNLFNLLPISPLDGGRVVKALAFSVHDRMGFLFLAIGIAVCIGGFIYLGLGLFVFIAVIGVMELMGDYFSYKRDKKEIQAMQVFANIMSVGGNVDDVSKRKEEAQLIMKMKKRWAGLKKKEVKVTLGVYLGLIGILFAINTIFSNVPGGDIAMKILTE